MFAGKCLSTKRLGFDFLTHCRPGNFEMSISFNHVTLAWPLLVCICAGLTSAVRILREVPSSKVTVVGHQMGWNTTTAGAAGLWGPYRIWDTPDDLVTRWSGVTLDHLYDLLHSEDAARAGISLRGVHWFKGACLQHSTLLPISNTLPTAACCYRQHVMSMYVN